MGGSDLHVMARHVLPNVVPPVAVLASLEMGSLILAISGLSFLGLGVQLPVPEWGAMLNEGRPFLRSAPQLMLYPGVAITLSSWASTCSATDCATSSTPVSPPE